MERQKYISNFEVSQGIGQYNSHDYYAILGAPITADINKIRKSYLHIARLLHPDTFGQDRSSSVKKQASQYLAKLVNPAYTFLMAEKERSEYSTILKLLAKRLIKQGQKITPRAEVAKNLLSSPTLTGYERAVEAIAIQQYQDLDKIIERTGQLSELNLVYILHQEGYQIESLLVPSIAVELLPNISITNRYTSKIKLIEEYISQKQWMLAVKELREYLKTDTENSYCQSLLGLAYMHQNLDGMAKVCFQQALKLNPQEPIAVQNINKIGVSKVNPNSPLHQKATKKKGFFGWLGGG
jgi:tetratricopeptide (TPR) repeat protein